MPIPAGVGFFTSSSRKPRGFAPWMDGQIYSFGGAESSASKEPLVPPLLGWGSLLPDFVKNSKIGYHTEKRYYVCMKIISLNTWGGRAGKEGLLSFFDTHKSATDVFCLQEMWSAPYEHLEGHKAGGVEIDHSAIMTNGLEEVANLLSDFVPYFRPHHGDHYGLLMLVRKSIEVKTEGEVFVYKHKGFTPDGDIGNHARNIQFIITSFNDSPLTIINFHGLWNGQGKGDSEDRLSQSKKIIDFIETLQGAVVLCGDFNLLPNTQSIAILESAGLRNLITENGITSTRTSHYTKPEKFADYTFVSAGLPIKGFKILPDEVSDHSPMQLIF